MLPTLHPRRLSDGVTEELLGAIRSGAFSPGEKLPSERRLAEQFGVSRVSVREGLRVLELLEVVDVRQGRGAFVVTPHARPSGQLLRHWLLAHREEVLELLEVREALEVTAAHAAALQGAAVDPPPEVAPEEVDRLVTEDIRFHTTVARSGGNHVLASLVEELNGVLEPSRYAMFVIPGRARRSHREHLSIVRAIARGNGDDAAKAMRRHLNQTKSDLQRLEVESSED
ncbi:MAG: FadR/GntR family transcriptional regulator [Actinomycetota bacterium]